MSVSASLSQLVRFAELVELPGVVQPYSTCVESATTDVTHVGSLASVGSPVVLLLCSVSELLATELTGEGIVLGVQLHVPDKTSSVRETFTAYVAFKPFQTPVSVCMGFECRL